MGLPMCILSSIRTVWLRELVPKSGGRHYRQKIEAAAYAAPEVLKSYSDLTIKYYKHS
jgi:hypothetical protein